MTGDEIEMVRQKAVWYEEFVEKYANGKLDAQITVDVVQNPVTAIDTYGDDIYGVQLPLPDKIRLKPDKNFDCLIITADYSGIPIGWLGITSGMTSWITFCHSGCSMEYGGFSPDEDTKRFHTNVYVHEWCHQLEYYFPTLDPDFHMPVLHNDQSEYGYTDANTGLTGEQRLVRWYADYIGGSIKKYPGATGQYRGVDAEWWQYPPSLWKDRITTSPENYAENVPETPVVTVNWTMPVSQTWSAGNYHLIIRDGTSDEELGFYRVTDCMSADRKTLSVDFGKPLYKMWDDKTVNVVFKRGKTYRITSYSLEYERPTTAPRYVNADFSILFTVEQ
jgi:hypothetical protein